MSAEEERGKRSGDRRDTMVVLLFLFWTAVVLAGFSLNSAGHIIRKLGEFNLL